MHDAFMTTPIMTLFLCLISGLLVGVFYFIHLWKSVQKLENSSKKQLFLNTLLRLSVFVCALLIVSAHNPARLLMFFIGFMTTRTIGLYTYKRKFSKEKSHA